MSLNPACGTACYTSHCLQGNPGLDDCILNPKNKDRLDREIHIYGGLRCGNKIEKSTVTSSIFGVVHCSRAINDEFSVDSEKQILLKTDRALIIIRDIIRNSGKYPDITLENLMKIAKLILETSKIKTDGDLNKAISFARKEAEQPAEYVIKWKLAFCRTSVDLNDDFPSDLTLENTNEQLLKSSESDLKKGKEFVQYKIYQALDAKKDQVWLDLDEFSSIVIRQLVAILIKRFNYVYIKTKSDDNSYSPISSTKSYCHQTKIMVMLVKRK